MKRLLLTLLGLSACICGCQNQQTVAANQTPATGVSSPAEIPVAPKADPKPEAPKAVVPTNASTQPSAPSAQPAQPLAPPSATAPSVTKASVAPPPSKPVPKENEVTIPVDRAKLKKALDEQKKANDKALRIAPNNTEDWGPSSYTADFVLKVMAHSVRSMKDMRAHLVSVAKSPEGTGNFDQTLKVRDESTFEVPFVSGKATASKYPALASEIVSNGKVKMVKIGVNWLHKVPAAGKCPDFPGGPERIALDMDRDFSRLVFAGVTDNVDSWATAADQWAKGVGGYKITVEERSVPVDKYHVKQYRLHLVRGAEAAKKLGMSEMEIVVDNNWGLPVTFRGTYTSPISGKSKGQTWQTLWGAMYEKPQKFTQADFMAPFDKKG